MKLRQIAVASFICLFVLSSDANARETTVVTIAGNLNSTSALTSGPPPQATFTELQAAANFSSSTNVLDSSGEWHTISIYFFKIFTSTLIVAAYGDAGELGGVDGTPHMLGEVRIEFSEDGQRVARPTVSIPDFTSTPLWSNTPIRGNIHFLFDIFTLLPSASAISSVSQNGCLTNCPQNGGMDFDGDGIDDVAIWRPGSGFWAIKKSSTGGSEVIWKQWGLPGDYPMPGPYFSVDHIADLVVWRPSNGTWYICKSYLNFDCSVGTALQFGLPGDRPVRGDFDGDGIFDLAVWRPSTLLFYFKSSRSGEAIAQQWGLPGDIPPGAGLDK